MSQTTKVVIVGAGFAGLNAAKELAGKRGIEVVLIDARNHHLFQPLLYQVAMAGLSPAEIAIPIRGYFSGVRNVRVIQGRVTEVDKEAREVRGPFGAESYDYLVIACGALQAYFGNEHWEEYAPGLKTVEQATEIRRRVLTAFERAERLRDAAARKAHLTFVIVGGGPTGVELAGAIGEMSRFTLAKDFREIDPKLTRILLVEAGPRILPSFDEDLSARATRDLETLGVQVWTNSMVTEIDEHGVRLGEELIHAKTVLWAAGVKGAPLGAELPGDRDRTGRVKVKDDLSLPDDPNTFVAGDMAALTDADGKQVPGLAPAAMQQGRYLGKLILAEQAGKPREPFRYTDKGQMATIGRRRAVLQSGKLKMTGLGAWLAWLLVHVYYLSGFKNRLFVLFQWAWSYFSFKRGARLIVGKSWRLYDNDGKLREEKPPGAEKDDGEG